ncbi:MAG: NUDIX domain-containing protein [Oscillospiraceae bacterium]|nr:NUDIX domain-containing protein [Oscillospiraceae bacterium]
MDLTFKTPEGNFNHRAVGLFVHDGRVLTMRDEKLSYAYLPGGRINLHESSENTIRREMREELGVEVAIDRLLWIVESYFTERNSGKRYHEVAFYYLLQPSEELLAMGESFERVEGDKHRFTFRWVSFAELAGIDFQPALLKGRFADLPGQIEHVVMTE